MLSEKGARSAARWVAAVALVVLSACESKPMSPAASRGRDVYLSNCIACHNTDPAQSGPLGPAIRGASRELLEVRVVRAAYPPGYRPKRETRQMVPLPQLADRIDDLYAYLNE